MVDKYSPKELLWQKTAANAGEWFGGNTVISPAVAVNSVGRVFVTGEYQGTATFGKIKLNSSGQSRIFLAELAPD